MLVGLELDLPHRALEVREEMRQRLRVVPHMRAGAWAAAGRVVAAFPGPESPVVLAQTCGRLEDRQICRDRFEDLRREG